MSIGFTVIEDAICITYKRGIYRQVSVYHRGKSVYARSGSGFIRLKVSGGTSDPNTLWYELEGVKGAKKEISKGGWVEHKK